jgi:hypothetical protein
MAKSGMDFYDKEMEFVKRREQHKTRLANAILETENE